MNWSHELLLDYCDVLSAVWTLILTAPIHCRGSIGEQVIFPIFPNFLMEKNSSTLGWPEGEDIFSKFSSLGQRFKYWRFNQWKMQHGIQFTHIYFKSLHPINLSVVLSLCAAVFLRPHSPPAWYLINAFNPAAGVTSCPSVLYLSASHLLEYWCGPALAAFDVSVCAIVPSFKSSCLHCTAKKRFC